MLKQKLFVRNELYSFLCYRGLSIKDFSNMAKITEFTLKGICDGKYIPSLHLALLICAVLDCKVDDIFYLEVKK